MASQLMGLFLGVDFWVGSDENRHLEYSPANEELAVEDEVLFNKCESLVKDTNVCSTDSEQSWMMVSTFSIRRQQETACCTTVFRNSVKNPVRYILSALHSNLH
jgi:hypothetical protein